MKEKTDRVWMWRRGALIAAGIVVLLSIGFVRGPDDDVFFKINKSIDVFGRVYKEIAANYVDQVDPEKFMMAGIGGMLGTLDPYTVYIGEQEGDEVELITNGTYGGIGVTIGVRDGAVRVVSVMDGYSAQRAGLLPGDKFLKIDDVPVDLKNAEQVRSMTRGEPGAEVRVLIEREGESKPLEFVLIRQEITVKNVTFAGYVEPGVGYVRLERFSRQAGEEVRQAIKELKVKGELESLILDVRGNPGGLLDAAVDVVSLFVPRGSLVVSTRGRKAEAEKKYMSDEEPLLPKTPLVLLADRASASASEIVAGALQDLDRAVIVGTRTFGKGLVQTILPLNFGAQLKVTTARYYTPSGRCIQEIDYGDRGGENVLAAKPDSLKKEFRTADGRPVYEHGGITPDSMVTPAEIGPMVRNLNRTALFFRFVAKYVARHKGEDTSDVSEAMVEEFRQFLAEEKFEFREDTELKLKEMEESAASLHYGREVLDDLSRLQSALKSEKSRAFDRYRDHIRRGLRAELMARLGGERGRIEASLKEDPQLAASVGLLHSSRAFDAKLGRQKPGAR